MSTNPALEHVLAAWDRTLDRAETCLREGDSASARLYLGQARAQLQSLTKTAPVSRLHQLGVFRRRSAEAIDSAIEALKRRDATHAGLEIAIARGLANWIRDTPLERG